MRLTAFQSGKGDCLLLETQRRPAPDLIDGGMGRLLRHVAAAMGALRDARKQLDIVYISHIDEDHIAGVLQMLDDEAAWRVHEHQLQTATRPTRPRGHRARPRSVRSSTTPSTTRSARTAARSKTCSLRLPASCPAPSIHGS